MCGICGVVENKDNRELVERMCDLLAHRGPDDAGVFQEKSVCLGHRRLSIIDLQTGNQPIFNHARDKCIIYNGEIYNYRELRSELLKRGRRFHTNSDTEVILQLYEEYGTNSFNKLNGIFAFAIYDIKREILILVRDHFGVKPLHYYCKDGKFIFASESKAILLHPAVKRELNQQSLHLHLNLRYTQSNETLFKGIFRLPPGYYLIIEKGQIQKMEPYYQLNPNINQKSSENVILEGIRSHLKEAVKRQLVSDVPIGVYLSGGMDSSSIVALMSEMGVDKINTFTLGFNEPTDEVEDAQKVADYFGTNHQKLSMELNPMKYMPEVIWHAEEPKINLLQGFLMSQFVSNHVKVVLGGLGGDELFAGYDIHKYIYPFEKFHSVLPPFIGDKILSPVSSLLFKLQNKTKTLRFDEYRRGLQLLLATGDIPRFYLILRNVWDFDPEFYHEIYSTNSNNQQAVLKFLPYFNQQNKGTPLERVFFTEFHTKMVNDYLLTEDRMSMAHSVEERVPFLDKDLVEFGFSIPAKMKMRGNKTKYLLRKAMSKYLPEEILEKKKWGFTFNPYLQYQKDLKATAQKILTEKTVREQGIFNYDYIKRIFDYPPHPRLRWHYNFIWVVMGFQIWKSMFIDSDNFINRQFGLEDYFNE